MSVYSQRNLAGGELDPALQARADMLKYATGLKTMRNSFIRRSGGAQNRAGTTYVGECYRSDDGSGNRYNHRLIPFHTSSAEYVLEIGNGYIRPLKNGSQILEDALTITSITSASPGVVTYTGADPSSFANGDEIRIVNSNVPELNNRNFKVASVNTGANTFALQSLDGTNFDTSALSLGGFTGSFSRIYTILSSNYISASLPALQYSQSGTEMLLKRTLGIDSLTYTSDTSWTLATVSFSPTVGTPATLTTTISGSAAAIAVAAVDRDTGEEGIARGILCAATGGGTITAAAVTNAKAYRFYVSFDSGRWGLLKEQAHRIFRTAAIESDSVDWSRAPIGDIPSLPGVWTTKVPWTDAGIGFPIAMKHVGQRLFLANHPSAPLKVYGSQLGSFKNFNRQYPLTDDGAVAFELFGEAGEIRHILNLNKLVLLTSKGEHVCKGNDAGIITPTEINADQIGYNGSDTLAPIVADGSAIFLQEGASVVRDLGFSVESSGYKGTDLTPFSAHLFDGYTILDWAYQKLPHSILWAVRNDGALLGLTYVKEHQIWGWHRHDTDGDYKRGICCVREGGEYALYFKVDREIDGRTVSMIERMSAREFTDQLDMNFMDAALSYDGRSTSLGGSNAGYMRLTGGTTWEADETLTLTSSSLTFQASDVGNEIRLYTLDADGEIDEKFTFTIQTYVGANSVTVTCDKDVPTQWRGPTISSITQSAQCTIFSTAHGLENGDEIYITGALGMIALNNALYTVSDVTADSFKIKLSGSYVDSSAYPDYLGGGIISIPVYDYARAVNSVSGLWHLEGKDVSVLGDGNVVSSPNNEDYDVLTVTDGVLDMGDQCYALIRVGLPYISDLETLDVDTADAETLSDKKSLITQLTLHLYKTRGLFTGAGLPEGDDPLEGLSELKLRQNENYDESTRLFTGKDTHTIEGDWDKNGRVAIRQVDPLPMGVMAIMPGGLIPAGMGKRR